MGHEHLKPLFGLLLFDLLRNDFCRAPVAMHLGSEVGGYAQAASWRNAPDPLENGLFAADELVFEILVKSGRAYGRGLRQKGQKPLDLRGEGDEIGLDGIKERLDTEPVATQNQTTRGTIVQGEGEHAVEELQPIQADFGIGLQDGLAVGAGSWSPSRSLPFGKKFAIVVDFAVGDQCKLSVTAFEGLMSACEVDDGQARMHQCHPAIYRKTGVVGTTVVKQARGSR